MKIKKSVKDFYTRYVDFLGRTNRSEYWLAVLWVCCATVAIPLAAFVMPTWEAVSPGFILFFVFCLTHFLPVLSITVRRLNDSGSPVSAICLFLVPVVGNLILLILLLRPSKVPSVNRIAIEVRQRQLQSIDRNPMI